MFKVLAKVVAVLVSGVVALALCGAAIGLLNQPSWLSVALGGVGLLGGLGQFAWVVWRLVIRPIVSTIQEG